MNCRVLTQHEFHHRFRTSLIVLFCTFEQAPNNVFHFEYGFLFTHVLVGRPHPGTSRFVRSSSLLHLSESSLKYFRSFNYFQTFQCFPHFWSSSLVKFSIFPIV